MRKKLERETGFEPATYGLEGHRSSQLSYSRFSFIRLSQMVGAKGFEPSTLCSQSRCAKPGCATPRLISIITCQLNGGAEEIRTPGLFRAREARSQLRYSPSKTTKTIIHDYTRTSRGMNHIQQNTEGKEIFELRYGESSPQRFDPV